MIYLIYLPDLWKLPPPNQPYYSSYIISPLCTVMERHSSNQDKYCVQTWVDAWFCGPSWVLITMPRSIEPSMFKVFGCELFCQSVNVDGMIGISAAHCQIVNGIITLDLDNYRQQSIANSSWFRIARSNAYYRQQCITYCDTGYAINLYFNQI